MEQIKLRDSLSIYGSKLSDRLYLDNNGQLIVKDAILARTGEYDYLESDIIPDGDRNKVVKVYRTPEDVFEPASMASFENKPFCDNHPEDDVCGSNYKELQHGYMRDIHRGEGDLSNCLLGTIVVTDPYLIKTIQNKDKRDLSLGYDAQIVIGDDGKYYMKKIRGNHVALVEDGRAGIATIRDNQTTKNLGGLETVKDKQKGINSPSMTAFLKKLFDENDVVEVEKIDDDLDVEEKTEIPADKPVVAECSEHDEEEVEVSEVSETSDKDELLSVLHGIEDKLGAILEKLTPAEPVVDAAPDEEQVEEVVEEQPEVVKTEEEVVEKPDEDIEDEDIAADATDDGFYDEAEDKDEDDDMQEKHDSVSAYRAFATTKAQDSASETLQDEINKAFMNRYKNVGGKN